MSADSSAVGEIVNKRIFEFIVDFDDGRMAKVQASTWRIVDGDLIFYMPDGTVSAAFHYWNYFKARETLNENAQAPKETAVPLTKEQPKILGVNISGSVFDEPDILTIKISIPNKTPVPVGFEDEIQKIVLDRLAKEAGHA